MTDNSKQAMLGLWSDITAGLTLLAALPYELGDLGVVVPVQLKPWVTGAGIVATVTLRLIKRWKEIKAAQP